MWHQEKIETKYKLHNEPNLYLYVGKKYIKKKVEQAYFIWGNFFAKVNTRFGSFSSKC